MVLYIYTIKTYYTGVSPYFGDIVPKLFGTLYNSPRSETEVFENALRNAGLTVRDLSTSTNQKRIFSALLKNPNNYLQQFNENDRIQLISLNDSNYDLSFTFDVIMMKQFIKELHNGHGISMKYGLYFSVINASNDIDFLLQLDIRLRRILRLETTPRRTPLNKIVYYTELNSLEDYLMGMCTKFSETFSLMYINKSWNKGNITDDTELLFTDTNRDNPMSDFIRRILRNSVYTSEYSELICQIPIPKHFFRTKIFIS